MSACGAIDELNCALGIARAALGKDGTCKALDEALARIQGECFTLGSILASAGGKGQTSPSRDRDMPADALRRLETDIDAWDAELPPLKTFILPGGTVAAAGLHLARAVARRAEREAVALAEKEGLPDGVIIYLNRLSSWLFTAARRANQERNQAETPWSGSGA